MSTKTYRQRALIGVKDNGEVEQITQDAVFGPGNVYHPNNDGDEAHARALRAVWEYTRGTLPPYRKDNVDERHPTRGRQTP